jgi:hypothetical protein
MKIITRKLFGVITLLLLISLLFLTISGCQTQETEEKEKSTEEQTEEKSLKTYEEDLEAIDEALNYID